MWYFLINACPKFTYLNRVVLLSHVFWYISMEQVKWNVMDCLYLCLFTLNISYAYRVFSNEKVTIMIKLLLVRETYYKYWVLWKKSLVWEQNSVRKNPHWKPDTLIYFCSNRIVIRNGFRGAWETLSKDLKHAHINPMVV